MVTAYSELYSSLNYGLRKETAYTLSQEEMLRCWLHDEELETGMEESYSSPCSSDYFTAYEVEARCRKKERKPFTMKCQRA